MTATTHDLDWQEPAARTSFTQVPDWLIEHPTLSVFAKGTYTCIARHINRSSGDAWPGVDRLATMVPCGTTKLNEALAELRAAGVLVTTRRGRGMTNKYRLRFTSPDTAARLSSSPPHGVLESRHAASNQTEKNQTEIEPKESARERVRGLRGDDVRDLIAAIDQEAEREHADRRFLGLWVRGDRDRVADVLSKESPAVRLELTLWLIDQVAAGWSGRGIAGGLVNGPLTRARETAGDKAPTEEGARLQSKYGEVGR